MNKKMFFYKFFQSPQHVGSIIPSSRFLTYAMLKPIDWQNTNSIVELGAGTGVFTSYIQKQKNSHCQVVVLEQDNEMRTNLQTKYPFFHYGREAKSIYSTIQEIGLRQVDCVISGLPFANFPPDLRTEIMDSVVQSLKPGGLFIAFQYSLQMRTQLRDYFGKIDISFVPINLPPAFVYCCQRAV